MVFHNKSVVYLLQRWVKSFQKSGSIFFKKNIKAYYIRVPTILEDISIARADGTYTNFLRKLSKYNILILDDFGINPLSADDATNLLEIIESRVDLSSVIITSQLPVSQWYDYLNNDTVADAILDRVAHSSHRVELKGTSMRKIMSTLK